MKHIERIVYVNGYDIKFCAGSDEGINKAVELYREFLSCARCKQESVSSVNYCHSVWFDDDNVIDKSDFIAISFGGRFSLHNTAITYFHNPKYDKEQNNDR